jgi:hypothetical protein
MIIHLARLSSRNTIVEKTQAKEDIIYLYPNKKNQGDSIVTL